MNFKSIFFFCVEGQNDLNTTRLKVPHTKIFCEKPLSEASVLTLVPVQGFDLDLNSFILDLETYLPKLAQNLEGGV